ncbi:hypothetical protein [Streptomyces sp. NBC_00272]|uniref:hypothetical protein n=1 Tax=Streptomyces sp. NBC_00272 TaxID=2975698 RepID=UPI002E29292D|nr:hypothetical protein [Streptomyces sp. NBC_00272]
MATGSQPPEPGASPSAARARRIADRLDSLLAREGARTGAPAPTYRELADRINRIAGRDVISKDTIRNLHLGTNQKGQAPNPTVDTLDWLGAGFGIKAGATYFLDEASAESVDAQLNALQQLAGLKAALGNSAVVALAERASGLSDNSLHMLVSLAERLKTLEADAAAPSPREDD